MRHRCESRRAVCWPMGMHGSIEGLGVGLKDFKYFLCILVDANASANPADGSGL